MRAVCARERCDVKRATAGGDGPSSAAESRDRSGVYTLRLDVRFKHRPCSRETGHWKASGTVLVCPMRMKVSGMTEDDLIGDAEVATVKSDDGMPFRP